MQSTVVFTSNSADTRTMRVSFLYHVTIFLSMSLQPCIASQSVIEQPAADRSLQITDTVLSFIRRICDSLDFLECKFLDAADSSDDFMFNDEVISSVMEASLEVLNEVLTSNSSAVQSLDENKSNETESSTEAEVSSVSSSTQNEAPSIAPSTVMSDNTTDSQNTIGSLFDFENIEPVSADSSTTTDVESTTSVIINVEEDDEAFVEVISATEQETSSSGFELAPSTSSILLLFYALQLII